MAKQDTNFLPLIPALPLPFETIGNRKGEGTKAKWWRRGKIKQRQRRGKGEVRGLRAESKRFRQFKVMMPGRAGQAGPTLTQAGPVLRELFETERALKISERNDGSSCLLKK